MLTANLDFRDLFHVNSFGSRTPLVIRLKHFRLASAPYQLELCYQTVLSLLLVTTAVQSGKEMSLISQMLREMLPSTLTAGLQTI